MAYDVETDLDLRKLLGRNIRAARDAAGLTQHELAKRLDERASVVSRWELGGVFPRPQALVALADALHVDVADLFKTDGEASE